MKKLLLLIVLTVLFSCTGHLYVHQVQVCDTLRVEVIDTLIQWEPVIAVDTFRGDSLKRVWMQWEYGGEFHQYLLKKLKP